MSERLRILVSGMVAGVPGHGGATWAVLQYVLGLGRLGHDVWFVEPVALETPDSSGYFRKAMDRFGLQERSALLLDGTTETIGVPYRRLVEAATAADVVINIAGMLTDERLLEHAPLRVYLDLDPAFTQLWHAVEGIDMRFDGHTHFVTVGQAIGRPECQVPTAGRHWLGTLPPVSLAHWPRAAEQPRLGFTTVGNWRGYGSIEHDGIHYGQRAHSMRVLLPLALRSPDQIELAIAIHTEEKPDLEALATHGWRLHDPADVAATPDRYQRFLQESKGELNVAKSGYVRSACGWFSDRSACYLASGRPVIAQDTGFRPYLPTGQGLLSFEGVDDALDAIEAVASDYDAHCDAARGLAEEHLDSDRVLRILLERVLATPSAETFS